MHAYFHSVRTETKSSVRIPSPAMFSDDYSRRRGIKLDRSIYFSCFFEFVPLPEKMQVGMHCMVHGVAGLGLWRQADAHSSKRPPFAAHH